MIASTVVFGRLLLEFATVAPAFLPIAAPWLTALLLLSTVSSFALWFRSDKNHEVMPEQENPSELKSALVFGLIYAVVLFVVAAVKELYGSRGLYAVAALSGLTDVADLSFPYRTICLQRDFWKRWRDTFLEQRLPMTL